MTTNVRFYCEEWKAPMLGAIAREGRQGFIITLYTKKGEKACWCVFVYVRKGIPERERVRERESIVCVCLCVN